MKPRACADSKHAPRRDLPQAKALAYTAGCIHARDRLAEITAITDTPPDAEIPRHGFVEKLLAGESIRIVAMSQLERFSEELRQRMQEGAAGKFYAVRLPADPLENLSVIGEAGCGGLSLDLLLSFEYCLASNS